MRMLRADDFRAIYQLLDGGQTVVTGADGVDVDVDCGTRCGAFCCRPGNTTKYLLPGEAEFLQTAHAQNGTRFVPTAKFFFDSFDDDAGGGVCACAPARHLRTFNCRVFPYAPRLERGRVVDVQKGRAARFSECWIDTPGATWRKNAVAAWDQVLADEDCRMLFARFGVIADWTARMDRGEPEQHALVALRVLEDASDDDVWLWLERFFLVEPQGA